jgi:hypothetical protein
MIRAVILFMLIAYGHFVSADDLVTEPQTKLNDIALLLERIKELEKRVSQLEATAKHANPSAPIPQPPQFSPPRYFPDIAPGPYKPNGKPDSRTWIPNATPVPPVPPAAPETNVPKTWRPFYFNGRWYYMVPCDNASAGVKRLGRQAIAQSKEDAGLEKPNVDLQSSEE